MSYSSQSSASFPSQLSPASQMAQPSASTLMAIVNTPNPVASTLPNVAWQPQAPTTTTKYKSDEPKYKMTDLKAIVLDTTAVWNPMVNGNMLTGMYIPVKYVVTTAKENVELKSFPYKFADPIRMNFPVKVDEKDAATDPNAKKKPKATFTLYDDKNRESLDEIKYFESKVNECLQAGVDEVRKQRQIITQKFYKAATVKPLSTDKRDTELISVIKSKDGINKMTNAEVTYRNFELTLNDNDESDDAPQKPNQKWKPKALPLFLFFSNNTTDFIQRNADGKITNGRPLTVQQLIDEKVEKVAARPVVAFGALYFMFNPTYYGVRVKRYIRSCEFIQAPQFQSVQQFGSGSNKYTHSDFLTSASSHAASHPAPTNDTQEPAAKRIKLDDDPSGGAQFVVQPPGGMQFVVQAQPQAPAPSSLMDLDSL
jgi:hypothetical protein